MFKVPRAETIAELLSTSTVFRHVEREYEWLEVCGLCIIREEDLRKLLSIESAYHGRATDRVEVMRPEEPYTDNVVMDILRKIKESGDPTYTKLLDEYNRRKEEKEERLEKCSKQLGESNG